MAIVSRASTPPTLRGLEAPRHLPDRRFQRAVRAQHERNVGHRASLRRADAEHAVDLLAGDAAGEEARALAVALEQAGESDVLDDAVDQAPEGLDLLDPAVGADGAVEPRIRR